MKSLPTQHFSLLYCFIIILLHYYNISVFPSKYKKIQGEIKSCKNSSGYFFPMHMEVEWVIGAGSWVRKIQTQGCSTPYIPIREGFDQCTLHVCQQHSPLAQAAHLSSCCVPGSWHVWSESSPKGQRGWSKTDQSCAPWLCFIHS